MYKSIFYHIVLILSLPFFSCANKGSKGQPSTTFDTCKIVIISPYGCYQEIEITAKGNGYLKSGLYSGSISDEKVNLDTVFSTDSFHIQKEQDLKDIDNVIKSILGTENIKGVPKTDTYRHKLFIDGECKIDVYGLSKALHELLSYLINYLPPSNDKCEFFELFKKSIHRSD